MDIQERRERLLAAKHTYEQLIQQLDNLENIDLGWTYLNDVGDELDQEVWETDPNFPGYEKT